MKKAFLTILITFTTALAAWAGVPVKLERLIQQYKGQDGFDVVSVGPVGLTLLRGAASLSGELDREERAALKSFRGIRKLVVVDYEDCDPAVRTRFDEQVKHILSGMTLILEAKDSSDAVRIYGTENGDAVQDCILYDSDGSLIFFRGRIDMERLGELMAAQQ